ncbi:MULTISPECIES: MarR family winged helix-turn-helix transcriptional regulator [Nocardiopsis]|uniref:Transcriptional regulator n=1 Tax=Nocardiopsis sinuspersici TaxID=501010 RepID=A0A1V3C3G6_9ACTN|nr:MULTISPECIES: MarR family winged helix-turn-helix transcriptional regulator [Nocardiopsis]OOC54910.1 transcriptional regulator [Nocardiopsis sinuspersici]
MSTTNDADDTAAAGTAAAGPDRNRVAGAGPVSHAIFRVARIHKLLAGQLLREVGLYPGQELLMMRLWDEGPQRQTDLVAVLDADAPTVTRSVRRLERAGFVRRSPSPTDGRVTIVEATSASMGLRQAVERIWADLERMTVADMDDDRREGVLRALGELERNLSASEEGRRGRRR